MLLTEHPLAGKLYHVKSAEVIGLETLRPDLESADYVLIGEKHDNPVHHQKQAEIVRSLGALGRSGQLVFEMAEQRQADQMADVHKEELEDLGDALEWEARGWPAWSVYQPIAEAAMSAGMRLKPGNPNRDEMMRIGRNQPVPEEALVDLRWDQTYNEQQMDSLLEELKQAHCGMMEKESLKPLASMQRYKDTHMARAMRQNRQTGDVSILIAGNGHVRRDRGVPMFLDDGSKIVTIALVEVVRGEMTPDLYPAFDPALYDYVWFGARVDEIDPCEKFREQLEKMKVRSNNTPPDQKQ